MAEAMDKLIMRAIPELRVEPVDKWVRASVDDVSASVVPHTGGASDERPVRIGADGPPVLDPRTPFTAHSCPGESLTHRSGGAELAGAEFAPVDEDLAGYLVLVWDAFTEWREEDDRVVGHPHDPHHRIDCLRTSRHVVVAAAGRGLADTRRATMLFESPLSVRCYIPADDVRLEALEPGDTRTVCAYKGEASYFSFPDGQVPDIAWTYPGPLSDAVAVKDLICFFTERLDLTVDDVEVPRPVTPWS